MNISNSDLELNKITEDLIDKIRLNINAALIQLIDKDKYYNLIKIIYEDLLNLDLSVLTKGVSLCKVLSLVEDIFKLCVMHNKSDLGDDEDTSVMLKDTFKINFEIEMTLVKIINSITSDVFDSQKMLIFELSEGLALCAKVADNLDIRASLPLWKCLSTLTSTYRGIFSQTSPKSFYAQLISYYHHSWLLRYQSWQYCQDNDREKQLKMIFFLIKSCLSFVTDYQSNLFDIESMSSEVFKFVFEIIKLKIEMVVSCTEESVERLFDDYVMFGCEILVMRLVDNMDIHDIITTIRCKTSEIYDVMEVVIFLTYVLKALTAKNEPEQLSLWIYAALMDVIKDAITNVQDMFDNNSRSLKYVYEQLLIHICSFICILTPCDFVIMESFIWSQILTPTFSVAWLFFTDVLIFLARYGPITVPTKYCSILFKILISISQDYMDISSVFFIGNLFNRFMKLIPEKSKKDLMQNCSNISLWFFFPWTSTDDVSEVTRIIDTALQTLLMTVKTVADTHICVVYEAALAINLLDKLRQLDFMFCDMDYILSAVSKVIESLTKDLEISEEYIISNIIYKYQIKESKEDFVNMDNGSSSIKRINLFSITTLLEEISDSSMKLSSLIQQEAMVTDDVRANLHSIIGTLSSLL